jgi:hypothetical protein
MTKYIPLITKEQGDNYDLDLTIVNKSGTPLNISDATIEYTIWAAKGGAVQATKTIGSGVTLTLPAYGKCSIATGIEGLAVGRYYHKAVVTLASVVGTVIHGPIRIK